MSYSFFRKYKAERHEAERQRGPRGPRPPRVPQQLLDAPALLRLGAQHLRDEVQRLRAPPLG